MGAPIYQNAASYGYSGQDENLGKKKKEKKTSTTGTVEGYTEDQKKRDAANAVMTKDTKAKSVRQGKLDRESEFDKTKDGIRETRKKERQAIKDKKKSLNIDKIEASGQSTGFDDSSERKKSRSKKRAAMRDARNAERGARRSDRAARQIKTLGDRNNMTVGEATKAYEARKATLNSYNKDAMKETATKVADNNAAIQAANDKAAADAANQTGDAFSNLNGIAGQSGTPEVVSSTNKPGGPSMLDMPTQQEATPDRAGMDLTTGRRGPGKFKFEM